MRVGPVTAGAGTAKPPSAIDQLTKEVDAACEVSMETLQLARGCHIMLFGADSTGDKGSEPRTEQEGRIQDLSEKMRETVHNLSHLREVLQSLESHCQL